MKIFLIICGIVWGSLSAQAAERQYVDCSHPDTFEKVIINILGDGSTGTLFISANVELEDNTGIMKLVRTGSQTESGLETVLYTATGECGTFEVGFPRGLIFKVSDRFTLQVNGVEMVCFSRLY